MVAVENNNLRTQEHLAQSFPGYLDAYEKHPGNRKTTYKWSRIGKSAAEFLKTVLRILNKNL
jgi:hypothetical protein